MWNRQTDDSGDAGPEARFSAGIDTLKDIFEIVKDIRKVTIAVHTLEYKTPGKAQHLKAKLIKQLFLRSAPLLNEEYVFAIKEDIDKILLAWMPNYMGKPLYHASGMPVPKNYYEAYDPKLEDVLDNIQFDIMLGLQDSGKYFMPYKEDDEGL